MSDIGGDVEYYSDGDVDRVRRRYTGGCRPVVLVPRDEAAAAADVVDDEWTEPFQPRHNSTNMTRLFEYRYDAMGRNDVSREAVLALLCQNDRTITAVDTVYVPITSCFVRYGLGLGMALHGNTMVRRIDIDPYTFYDYNESDLDAFDRNDAAPFLQYVGTSSILQHISLAHEYEFHPVPVALRRPVAMELTGHILKAMTDNAAIETLCVEVELPVDDFVHFLKSARFICKITLKGRALQWLFLQDALHLTMVADGFGSCQALESLHLDTSAHRAVVTEQIIGQLSRLSSLRDLGLCDVTEFPNGPGTSMTAISSLLSAMTGLQTLSLSIVLDEDNARLLVEGLEANRSVTRLQVELGLESSPEAATLFVDFVNDSANRNGSKLRELSFTTREAHIEAPVETIRVLSTIGIGSALESFERRGSYLGSQGFIDFLAANESDLPLKRLRLEQLDRLELDALARCLPCLTRLQHLFVTVTGDVVSTHAASAATAVLLTAALRRNGSLLSMVASHQDDDTSVFTKRETEVVQALLARNANAAKMADQTCRRHGPGIMAAAGAKWDDDGREDGDNADTKANAAVVAPLECVPALFLTTLEAPRTGPNALLSAVRWLGPSDRQCSRRGTVRMRNDAPCDKK